MPKRDITGTNTQGVPSGPRPNQKAKAPAAPEEVVKQKREKEIDATDPVVDVDELAAAAEVGDDEGSGADRVLPVDVTLRNSKAKVAGRNIKGRDDDASAL
jgi:hypothetical protein